jgi:hypothetical protein
LIEAALHELEVRQRLLLCAIRGERQCRRIHVDPGDRAMAPHQPSGYQRKLAGAAPQI